MVQLTTQGIKVSVETKFEGTFFQDGKMHYGFSYQVEIANNSETTIQLISRYWLIKDALNHTEIVEGKGVIGLQPIIEAGEKHTYISSCLLFSPFGSMQGHYHMITPDKKIKVGIPLFKLTALSAMN